MSQLNLEHIVMNEEVFMNCLSEIRDLLLLGYLIYLKLMTSFYIQEVEAGTSSSVLLLVV